MSSNSHKQELLELIDQVQNVPVAVVGDLILDRYIWGNVNRISPEAPVPIVEVLKVEDRLGGAANVARNLVNMGARVWLAGVIGQDDVADLWLKLAKSQRVDCGGVVVDASRPTSIKTRVIAGKQQIVRIDQELKIPVSSKISHKMQNLIAAQIDSSKAVIASDYGKGALSPEIIEFLAEGCDQAKFRLAGRPLVVDPHPANYSNYRRMSVAKPNRREAERAVNMEIKTREDGFAAATKLLEKWNAELAMITLGEDGLVMAFADGRAPIARPTVAHSVFDVSGAGDTVTALCSLALAVGASPSLAGDLANIAAGVVVSEVGTAPITLDKLKIAVATYA